MRVIREFTVRICDEPHVVSVYRKSKSVWVAVGDYIGELVEVKGPSAPAPAKHWAATAWYRSN